MKCQWSVTLNYCFTRALASIEAIGRVKQSDMNQCSANAMPKTLQWQWFKIVRVPPLNIFRRSSRPIRGQDFWLSTNQKPRFQPDFEPPLNLNPSNPLPIQWKWTNAVPIQCQCSATWNYCFTQPLASIEAIGRVKQSEMNQCSATVSLQSHCVTE